MQILTLALVREANDTKYLRNIHKFMEIWKYPSAPTPFVFSGAVHLCRPGDSGDKTNHSDAQLPERQSNPPDLGTAVTQIDTNHDTNHDTN